MNWRMIGILSIFLLETTSFAKQATSLVEKLITLRFGNEHKIEASGTRSI